MGVVPRRYKSASSADKGELMTYHRVISYRKDGVCEFTSSPTFPSAHHCTFCHPPAWMVGAKIQETDFDQSALDRTVKLLNFALGSDFNLGDDVCVRQCQLRLYAVVGKWNTPTQSFENLNGDKYDVCTVSGTTDWNDGTCLSYQYTYSGKTTWKHLGDGEWGTETTAQRVKTYRITPGAPTGPGGQCENVTVPESVTEEITITQSSVEDYLNDPDATPLTYTLSSPSSSSKGAREAAAQIKADEDLVNLLDTTRTLQSADADHVYDFFDLNNATNFSTMGETYVSEPEQEFVNGQWVDKYVWMETIYSTVHVFLVAIGLKPGSYTASCVQYTNGSRGTDLSFTLTIPPDTGYAKSTSATTTISNDSTLIIADIPDGTAGTTCSLEELSGIPGEPDIIQAIGAAGAIFNEVVS